MRKYEIFWGGEDVSPTRYGEIISSYCGHVNHHRDKSEFTTAQYCLDKQVPMIGICRGAQLLNVVNGGSLHQHVTGHATGGTHFVETKDGHTFQVNSTHHQMMVPTEEAELLAWDNRKVSGIKQPQLDIFEEIDKGIEVVFYPKTKSLCVQFHPEWLKQDSEAVVWLNKIIKEKLKLDPINFNREMYEDTQSFGGMI